MLICSKMASAVFDVKRPSTARAETIHGSRNHRRTAQAGDQPGLRRPPHRQDGQIPWPTDKGFYHSDTRVISAWRIFADGEPWELLNSGNIAYYANRIFLTNRDHSHRDRRGPGPARWASRSAARSTAASMRISISSTTAGQGSVQPRNRRAQRLRRYLRGQVRRHRPARPDHHQLVARPLHV